MNVIQTLSKKTGLTDRQLLNYARTASRRYKVYQISKRGGGTRTIAQPSKDIKALQRFICRIIRNEFLIHEAATAYKKGASIAINATKHKDSLFTLKLDFSEFFESFTLEDVKSFLINIGGFSQTDAEFMSFVFCRNGTLSIGAPSSPYMTNVMMYDFDSQVFNKSISENCIYTRYADDIFISTSVAYKLQEMYSYVKTTISNYNKVNIVLNDDKTAFLSKKYRRAITGIVVTPDHKISIGRNRKRKIRTEIYLAINNKLDVMQLEQLKGLIAFAYDVEPDFISSLKDKFGEDNLRSIIES